MTRSQERHNRLNRLNSPAVGKDHRDSSHSGTRFGIEMTGSPSESMRWRCRTGRLGKRTNVEVRQVILTAARARCGSDNADLEHMSIGHEDSKPDRNYTPLGSDSAAKRGSHSAQWSRSSCSYCAVTISKSIDCITQHEHPVNALSYVGRTLFNPVGVSGSENTASWKRAITRKSCVYPLRWIS